MNFRRILSKSSIKSSGSSGNNSPENEKITKLQSEIEILKQNIDSLKLSLENRDAAIGTLAREKEQIYVELKSTQRTNRNLHQELIDQRDMHSKEKEYLIDEIKRLSERCSRFENNNNTGDACVMEDTKNEDKLLEELKSKDEVICNISAKYLKVMSTKKHIEKKLQRTMYKSQKICENVVFLLQENKQDLDNLLSKLMYCSTTTPDTRKYIKLLRLNASLHYENTQLKVLITKGTILGGRIKEGFSDNDVHCICNRRFNNMINKNTNNGIDSRRGPMQCKSSIMSSGYTKDSRKFEQLHLKQAPRFYRKLSYSYSDPSINANY